MTDTWISDPFEEGRWDTTGSEIKAAMSAVSDTAAGRRMKTTTEQRKPRRLDAGFVGNLIADIEELIAERDRLQAQNNEAIHTITHHEIEVVKLKAERDALRKALLEYGEHSALCETGRASAKCNCGFEAALNAGSDTREGLK